ncbi:MAG: hypothetical protein HRU70_10725 [Phycisphaeraceae bacterium]|nr:MAG: hypothetical protein HRU70_10725 [Phycisphaeraceae bacterium]
MPRHRRRHERQRRRPVPPVSGFPCEIGDRQREIDRLADDSHADLDPRLDVIDALRDRPDPLEQPVHPPTLIGLLLLGRPERGRVSLEPVLLKVTLELLSLLAAELPILQDRLDPVDLTLFVRLGAGMILEVPGAARLAVLECLLEILDRPKAHRVDEAERFGASGRPGVGVGVGVATRRRSRRRG